MNAEPATTVPHSPNYRHKRSFGRALYVRLKSLRNGNRCASATPPETRNPAMLGPETGRHGWAIGNSFPRICRVQPGLWRVSRAVLAAAASVASIVFCASPTMAQTGQEPDFGTAAIADQSFTTGTSIGTLTLPEATGGSGTLSYSLTPPPGLSFNAATRVLSGTPSTFAPAADYTYTVTDASASASLTFAVTIQPAGDREVTMNWTTIADTGVTRWEYSYLPAGGTGRSSRWCRAATRRHGATW